MKTHQVATALEQLARILRQGPNVTLETTRLQTKKEQAELSLGGMAVNLSTLASLSRLKKQQWQEVIEHYHLPVTVKSADSVRDLLGRLLGYLEKDDAARERLSQAVRGDPSAPSPELMRALQFLLKE
jgi:hypothetical protein